MFFAISGYLITGLLVDEQRRTGAISLRRFYRPRAARLVPALLALVIDVVLVELPTIWAGCFVVGAATLIYGDKIVPSQGLASYAVPLALAALVLLSMVHLWGHVLTYLAGGPVIAVLTCVLIIAGRTWHVVDSPLPSLMVGLGTISYGAYLWNYPLTLWLRTTLDGPGRAVTALALTLLAALISHRWVERPFLRQPVPA